MTDTILRSNDFELTVKLAEGGRWSSLRDAHGKEWLLQSDAAGRNMVQPGDAFVDGGGLEECLPTIGGQPDHGDVWSRPWSGTPESAWVQTPDLRLQRDLQLGDAIRARYLLQAEPGFRFIWAAHCILELGEGARLIAPADAPVRCWPGHVKRVEGTWPAPLGLPLDVLGPDDGSAMFFLFPGLGGITVEDAGARLRFALSIPGGQPGAIGVWRNLGGYPWDGTPVFRNIGIEPMIGTDFDLAAAAEGETGTVGPSGQLQWEMVISRG